MIEGAHAEKIREGVVEIDRGVDDLVTDMRSELSYCRRPLVGEVIGKVGLFDRKGSSQVGIVGQVGIGAESQVNHYFRFVVRVLYHRLSQPERQLAGLQVEYTGGTGCS